MKRVIMRVDLKLNTPWHIGTLDSLIPQSDGSESDVHTRNIDAILRDPRTKMPYVPGSSIGGSLRATAKSWDRKEKSDFAGVLFGDEFFGEVSSGSSNNKSGRSSSQSQRAEPRSVDSKSEHRTSPWWILGTHLELPDNCIADGQNQENTSSETDDPSITKRTRNRIDRNRGAASDKALFTMEGVKADGILKVYLSCDYENSSCVQLSSQESPSFSLNCHGELSNQSPDKRKGENEKYEYDLLKNMVQLIAQRWRPRIGAHTSIGMGDASVVAITYRIFDLSETSDILLLLGGDSEAAGGGFENAGGGAESGSGEACAPIARAEKWLANPIEITLDSEGKIVEILDTGAVTHKISLMSDKKDSGNLDPAGSQGSNNKKIVKEGNYLHAEIDVPFLAFSEELAKRADTRTIYGSTWKGLLRSRVEFIGRSLGIEVCGAKEIETCGKEESATNGTEKWEGCGTCDVCKAFGSTAAPGVWIFKDSELKFNTSCPKWKEKDPESKRDLEIKRIEELNPGICHRSRNAIDRFTGGVRDSALYTQWYRRGVNLSLDIDKALHAAQPEEWVKEALLWALKDLDDGLIAIGPESAAGYGLAEVKSVKVEGNWIKEPEEDGKPSEFKLNPIKKKNDSPPDGTSEPSSSRNGSASAEGEADNA